MRFLRTTKKHKEYWQKRDIDWQKEYTATWNHPHRALLCEILKTFEWKSLIEIGCGSGANLIRILKDFRGVQVGGIDINAAAIETAKKTFTGGVLKVGVGDDIMLSDNAADVILTDRTLIYVSPRHIGDYIKEIRRIGRHRIILCEFYEPRWLRRIKLRWTSGYHAYDYPRLLHHYGFYDIILYQIPSQLWPGDTYPSFVITAKIPQRK